MIPLTIAARGYRAVYEPAAVASEEATEMAGFSRRVRIAVGNIQQLRYLGLFLWPPRPWLLFGFVAHKGLRLFGPLLLLAALVLNCFLPGPPYLAALLAQAAFYALAFLGWLLGERAARLRPFKLPYYFCMVNAAYLIGFLRVLTGAGLGQWNVRRAASQAAGKGAA